MVRRFPSASASPGVAIFVLAVATALKATVATTSSRAVTPLSTQPPSAFLTATFRPRGAGVAIARRRRWEERSLAPSSSFWGTTTTSSNRLCRTLFAHVEEDEEEIAPPMMIPGFDDEDDGVGEEDESSQFYASMTVEKLKQQLRLRGLKVGGNKAELIERLMLRGRPKNEITDVYEGAPPPSEIQQLRSEEETNSVSGATPSGDAKEATYVNEEEAAYAKKVVADARARGGDVVDVSAYVVNDDDDDDDKENDEKRKSKKSGETEIDEIIGEDSDDDSSKSSPEVWGRDARIVEDYEGRSAIVDGLSRTVVEYTGDGGETVRAYVAASRDALQRFLSGGNTKNQGDGGTSVNSGGDNDPKKRVYEEQSKRESESARTLLGRDRLDDTGTVDDGSDEEGIYDRVVPRDYGDWGVYSQTGASVSSQEVRAVLLLSDVNGPFSEDMKALADKIAFECQPLVVFAPDMFRGRPWKPSKEDESRNDEGQTYEQWRSSHPDRRVNVDVRAAAAVLRERYAASGIAVWGLCYGGGRALEAAAATYPYEGGGIASYREETFVPVAEDGEEGVADAPPHVDPVACVAWYPTRYDATRLFGKDSEGFPTFEDGTDRKVAVMAIFGGEDDIPGATPDDAALLKECLDNDPRVKDAMVKIFPGRGHAFAHTGLGGGEEDDERRRKQEQSEADRFLEEEFGGPIRSDFGDADMGGDAEVACLLSTAWMETYARTFLPTVGPAVRDDEDERWSTMLEMDRVGGKETGERRDVRKEIEESIANHVDDEVDLRRMPQSRSPLLDIDNDEDAAAASGTRRFNAVEEERDETIKRIKKQYDMSDDDDEETYDLKVRKAYEDGAFKDLLVDGYWDEENDAFW